MKAMIFIPADKMRTERTAKPKPFFRKHRTLPIAPKQSSKSSNVADWGKFPMYTLNRPFVCRWPVGTELTDETERTSSFAAGVVAKMESRKVDA